MKIKDNVDLKDKPVVVEWWDSNYESGWQDIVDYSPIVTKVTSWGVVTSENEDAIALSHNLIDRPEENYKHANGIMIIPKCCIKSVTSF